jgi:hypothetical protein
MRESLFLPYFSTKQRGTGLGLSIAAKILQEHHASIRAEKNIPTGARFILELRPAADPNDTPAIRDADLTDTPGAPGPASGTRDADTTLHTEEELA